MARARRLPDVTWLRRWLTLHPEITAPARWDQPSLETWMETVPSAQWRYISRAWNRRRFVMEPARDPATEHMDARLNERSHQWQMLLRSVPAHVRARIHVIADRHPDADPWGIHSLPPRHPRPVTQR